MRGRHIFQTSFLCQLYEECTQPLEKSTDDFIAHLWGKGEAPFEIYARAKSTQYFENLKCLFDIESKDELIPLVQTFQEKPDQLFPNALFFFNPTALLGYKDMATTP